MLAEGEAAWGRYDEAADEVASGEEFAKTGEDLLDPDGNRVEAVCDWTGAAG